MPKKNKSNEIIIGDNNNIITLIFCHGLGDNPTSWIYFADKIKKNIQNIKIILLKAEDNKVSVNNGLLMPSWFDILEIPITLKTINTTKYIDNSINIIHNIISSEIERGINPNKIFIGGFSQGAALSLIYSQYKKYKLGGIIMLSGWMLDINSIHILKNLNINIPIFIGHGTNDNIVLYENIMYLDNILRKNKFTNITFNTYNNMGHNCSNKEIYDIIDWINYLIK
jgi:phospholipase/carboxylesterase